MQQVDPFTYPDWNERLLTVPCASIFHTTHWLRILQESYGYQPHYFACFTGKQLTALLPFMEVKSWATGVRGVSLPFSDYCEPIIDEQTSYPECFTQVIRTAQQRKWKFLEMRGGEALLCGVSPYTSYYRHVLALCGDAEAVFSKIRSNYRAKIRKARRSGLTATILRSPEAMAEYYRLHCLTRKRHGLLPQPAVFFQKIHAHIIANNCGFVMLVSHRGRNIAGAVFFMFGQRAMYKFGASDLRYQHLHPNYLLFWHVVQWLGCNGYKEICFGRTAEGNQGLMQFKDGWGTSKSLISYYRYDPKTASFMQNTNRAVDVGYNICRKMPIALLKLAGSVLYKHIG
jgi:CelD/BcsL family acetyltransferase involved in cellulose biosynthesis